LIHTADLHVGCSNYKPTGAKAGIALERARAMLTEMLELARHESVDAIVVSGDWFERPSPSHYERETIAQFVTDSVVPIFGITGNHDRFGAGMDDNAMNWASPLRRFGSRVWARPTGTRMPAEPSSALPGAPPTAISPGPPLKRRKQHFLRQKRISRG